MAINILVNGKAHRIQAAGEMPLLWVLRDLLGLTGTKFGCGIQQCGACTVLIDGRPQRSCGIAIGSLDGAKIVTVEGLSPDNSHPVQKAWIEQEVPQCGYCQSGQIMTAVALLARNPNPNDKDIDEAIVNICRCGSYSRIRSAVKRGAEIMRQAKGGKR